MMPINIKVFEALRRRPLARSGLNGQGFWPQHLPFADGFLEDRFGALVECTEELSGIVRHFVEFVGTKVPLQGWTSVGKYQDFTNGQCP